MTKREREMKKIKAQLGISDRKSIEERGRQCRPCTFQDKRALERKYASRKFNASKISY